METLPYVILAVGASFLAILAAIRFTSLHREARNKVTVLLLCWSVIWLLMSALEVSTDSLPTKLLFFSLKYVGILAIPTTWLILAIQLSGHESWVNRSNIAKASVVPLITLLLVLTNGTRGIVWSNVTLNVLDPFLPLNATPNLAYWLLDIAYAYVAVSIAAFILVRRIAASRTLFRRQAVPLIFVCCVPLMFDVIYNLYNSSLFMHLNLTPLMLTVAASITLWRLDYLPGAGLVPVAYEMIVDSMKDAVIILDSQNRIVDLNPTAQDLLSHTISKAVGAPVEEIWAEWASVQKELESDPTRIREVSLDGAGKKRTYELQSSYLSGIMSRSPNVLVVLRDITERKRAEEALRRSEEKYRGLVENINDVVFSVDATGHVTYISPVIERVTGHKADEAVGQPFSRFIHPDDLPSLLSQFGRVLAGDLAPFEFRVFGKDGDVRYVRTSSRPLMEAGELLGLTGVMVDITERQRMQAELEKYMKHLEELVDKRTKKLAESERRFRELADLLPQPVFETDKEAKFTFANRAAFALTGYNEEDLRRGVNAFDLIVPEDQERLAGEMMRILRGEYRPGVEYRAVRKDGSTFPILLYGVSVMRGNEFMGFRAIAVDISERKRMEEELLKSRHLAAIGETAAMVGHDLRNPIQGIVVATHLLKRKEDRLDDEGKETVHVIEACVLQSEKIINDLLEYSREPQLQLSTSNAKSLIEQSLASLKIPENIHVVNATEEEPTLEVDVEKMHRVFVNIMKNAVDAMPNGGTLTITSTESDGNLQVSFADTGTGIDKEILAKIWEPLFTTKAQGMGYGLAIVKRFVEAHGGLVNVESTPGKGSTFTVRIPKQEAKTSIEP